MRDGDEESIERLGKFMEQKNTNIIAIPYPKSRMTIGNLVIMNEKHFNWFHKLMWRIILGIKIEDIKEEEYD